MSSIILLVKASLAGTGRGQDRLRKSNKEAAETRATIVATAADAIRRAGLAEASLADVMAATSK